MASWKHEDIPDMTNKVVLITGGSAGIGKEAALAMAKKKAHVFILSRNPEKTMAAIEAIKKESGNEKVEFIECDNMSFASVEACAKKFLERNLPIHVLLNNAGIMAPPFTLSKDGIESQIQTNHFSHFLLTHRLLPKIIESAPSRIVNVASIAHKLFASEGMRLEHLLNDPKNYSPYKNYGQTKLANILFTNQLNKVLQERGVTNVFCNSCHPGAIKTELSRNAAYMNRFSRPIFNFFLMPITDGALTSTYLSCSPEVESKPYKGEYFVERAKFSTPSTKAHDPQQAKALWDWTVKVLLEKGIVI